MLPESFKDIRFNVTTDQAAFSGLSLKVTGVKQSGSPKVDTEYHPLTITLQAPSALESTYFSTLKSRFAVADQDVIRLEANSRPPKPRYIRSSMPITATFMTRSIIRAVS
jgi:hypothetical protein